MQVVAGFVDNRGQKHQEERRRTECLLALNEKQIEDTEEGAQISESFSLLVIWRSSPALGRRATESVQNWNIALTFQSPR